LTIRKGGAAGLEETVLPVPGRWDGEGFEEGRGKFFCRLFIPCHGGWFLERGMRGCCFVPQGYFLSGRRIAFLKTAVLAVHGKE